MATDLPLVELLLDTRDRTLDLVRDLTDDQLIVPHLEIVNPFTWELGHVAWFYEQWCLRKLRGLPPLREDGDALWNSMAVHHDTRWDLPMPSRAGTLAYMQSILDQCRDALLDRQLSEEEVYLHLYSVQHEDMHAEAFTWTRQTLAYPAPSMGVEPWERVEAGGLAGDVEVPEGTYRIGQEQDCGEWCFDNEKWAHDVELSAFQIARAPVTNAEYAEFVEADGYTRSEFWDEEGWKCLRMIESECPRYWRRVDGAWQRRHFDQWTLLPPHEPIVHVSWFEASAYCRWAKRRLPSEAEWEVAATGSKRGNLGWRALGPIDVGCLPETDSDCGCRQMLGNVWEWTADAFGPFPGFTPDMYKDYSAPWFGDHRVARGGCWATQPRMARRHYRNYAKPWRRDLFYGFRTCALSS